MKEYTYFFLFKAPKHASDYVKIRSRSILHAAYYYNLDDELIEALSWPSNGSHKLLKVKRIL